MAFLKLSENQIKFMNTLIDHLTEKSQAEPDLLYEGPVIDPDPTGAAGLFSATDAAEVILILGQVRERAAA